MEIKIDETYHSIAMVPMTSRPGHVGMFISVDVAGCFLLNLLPKKRVRGENSIELMRNKLYKSAHQFIGNNFF